MNEAFDGEQYFGRGLRGPCIVLLDGEEAELIAIVSVWVACLAFLCTWHVETAVRDLCRTCNCSVQLVTVLFIAQHLCTVDYHILDRSTVGNCFVTFGNCCRHR